VSVSGAVLTNVHRKGQNEWNESHRLAPCLQSGFRSPQDTGFSQSLNLVMALLVAEEPQSLICKWGQQSLLPRMVKWASGVWLVSP
jgi:hypothetical protein